MLIRMYVFLLEKNTLLHKEFFSRKEAELRSF